MTYNYKTITYTSISNISFILRQALVNSSLTKDWDLHKIVNSETESQVLSKISIIYFTDSSTDSVFEMQGYSIKLQMSP